MSLATEYSTVLGIFNCKKSHVYGFTVFVFAHYLRAFRIRNSSRMKLDQIDGKV